ncbi:MAG: Gfo/Idh/MocA family oxidoreductase [Spirochaetales bacterium]|nr:Gfo/Idh/MocA family oxidoreductase [Spirochaetales bacterium]MCF7939247.1 Gfo/Idh/MocA family oxidoreductase [Spirochaetales bacterium]
MDTTKIGLIGCGNISDVYIQNVQKWPVMEIAACADQMDGRAEEKAKQYGIPKACSVQEVIDDKNIDVVLNLTTPQSHAEICLAALNAGKHAFTEKPLAVHIEDGKKMVETAKKKNLFLGSAPDTFLGGRLQTARKLIDDGWIGEPIAATAFCAFHGHEVWHPDPEFLYQEGAGPMLDMGVYYMTALVSLLGPVGSVVGNSKRYFDKRTITSEPKYGQTIDVDIDTHITGVMEFQNNVSATIMMSFDVWDPTLPRIEIYGKEGTLYLSEDDPYGGPNIFGGKVQLRRGADSDWVGFPTEIPRKECRSPFDEIPLLYGYTGNSRGIGLADMVYAIRSGRKNRANGEMAYHVLETMYGFLESSKKAAYYKLNSTCEKPQPLKIGLPEYVLEE